MLPPFDCTGRSAINLTNRGLQSLDNNTFMLDTCRNVTAIYLGCHPDGLEMKSDVFQGLTLETLDLRYNRKHVTLGARAFNNLTVKSLYLSHNDGTIIWRPSYRAFEGATVEKIYLNNNPSSSRTVRWEPGVGGSSKFAQMLFTVNGLTHVDFASNSMYHCRIS